MDRPIGGGSTALMWKLYRVAVINQGEALTLTINPCNPIHSYDHELWVVTERTKSQRQWLE